jgi:N-acetylglucosamine-6-phosphate deacetylase
LRIADRFGCALGEAPRQLATLDGTVDLGIAEKTGALTPGKRADTIL